jgi:hypothetical protein
MRDAAIDSRDTGAHQGDDASIGEGAGALRCTAAALALDELEESDPGGPRARFRLVAVVRAQLDDALAARPGQV